MGSYLVRRLEVDGCVSSQQALVAEPAVNEIRLYEYITFVGLSEELQNLNLMKHVEGEIKQ